METQWKTATMGILLPTTYLEGCLTWQDLRLQLLMGMDLPMYTVDPHQCWVMLRLR